MTPGLLMLLGAGAILVGIIGAVLNFAFFAKKFVSFDGSTSFVVAAVIHIISALFYGSGILALIGGFIWFLVTVAKSA